MTIAGSSVLGLVVILATFLATGGESSILNWVCVVVTAFQTAAIATFTYRVLSARSVRAHPPLKLATVFAMAAATSWFTYKQFIPYRIKGVSADAAGLFGSLLDTEDQTAYGYPSPFLRHLDSPLEHYGQTIVHWDGLFTMLFLWMVLLFVFASITGAFAQYLESRNSITG